MQIKDYYKKDTFIHKKTNKKSFGKNFDDCLIEGGVV